MPTCMHTYTTHTLTRHICANMDRYIQKETYTYEFTYM